MVAVVLAFGFAHPIAYNFPTLRATAESAVAVLAVTAAWLAGAQFVQENRLRDLLLMAALVALALVEFVVNMLPAALRLHHSSGFVAVGLAGQLVVAAALVASAVTSGDAVTAGGRRTIVVTVALTVLAVAVAGGVGLLLSGHWLTTGGIDNALESPVFVALVLGSGGLLAYAATEFARRGRAVGQGALPLLAGAAILLAAARLYSLSVPAASLDSITIQEGLRLLAVVLVLAAMLRQDFETRVTARRAAAIAERRRVAEDLHDGLAQDLAFIAAFGSGMSDERGGEHPLAVAARRALAVSRDTISELSDMSSTPLREGLEAVAQELRDRFKIAIAVDVDPQVELAPAARDHVARIVREAIANAARHGHAKTVAVSLSFAGDGTTLRVRDDGCGIGEDADMQSSGFGLGSMRERAHALGGQLTVRQRQSGGTEVVVVLP
jgi:signal transduction histidine kinase